MNTSCSTKSIKYLMFSFNLVFVITGIVLISVGASIHSNYSTYNIFLDGKYFSLPNLLIATGVLIFVISFLGCYGAFKESWLMLMAFSVLLGVIFIFEFSAGIAGYVLRDKTIDYLQGTLSDTMKSYTTNKATASMWDLIQEEFTCCGVKSPEDWINVLKQGTDLPISCCKLQSGAIGTFNCNINGTSSRAISFGNLYQGDAGEVPGDDDSGSGDDPATSPSTSDATENSTDQPTSEPTTETSTTGETTVSTTIVTDETTVESTSVSTVGESTTVDPPTTEKPTSTTVEEQTTEPTAAPPVTRAPSDKPYYEKGCRDSFGDWVKSHAVHIGVVGFIFAIIQVAGIGFACYLSRQLKNRYYST